MQPGTQAKYTLTLTLMQDIADGFCSCMRDLLMVAMTKRPSEQQGCNAQWI